MMKSLRPLLALVVLAGCSTAQAPTWAPERADAWSHGLVIDASSSASTLYSYRWRPSDRGPLPEIRTATADCDPVEPGLGSYGGRPAEAAASLAPLLACARTSIGDDPDALRRTSLYLRGTAGLRLLPDDQRGEILDAARELLDGAGFGTTSARVISGDEEGIYGWLAVNYLLGHLEHGGPFPTVGALDLGGASTQITFIPLDFPRVHGVPVTLAGNTYHLYTHSYLGLGQDEARLAVDSPACFLANYPIPGGGTGTGDFDGCRAAIASTHARECDDAPCSLFGVYQPPVYGDFLAFSVYAYTARFFGIQGRLTPALLAAAGAEFCGQDWNELLAADPSVASNPYLPNYCFSAAYVVTLLTDGFGFSADTDRVHAQLQVQGERTNWSLGALLYELAGDSD